MVNNRQEEVSPDYDKRAKKLDSHVPGGDVTPFQDKLKTFGVNGRVLGPTVGAWCEVSEDFDLILDLIAHALGDEETSTIHAPGAAPSVGCEAEENPDPDTERDTEARTTTP